TSLPPYLSRLHLPLCLPLFPYTTLFRSVGSQGRAHAKTVESVCVGIRDTTFTFISRTQPDDLDNWEHVGSDGAREATRNAELIRSEEHTSELQSRFDLVCRLLLEKKKKI